jgi:hypothetical protein
LWSAKEGSLILRFGGDLAARGEEFTPTSAAAAEEEEEEEEPEEPLRRRRRISNVATVVLIWDPSSYL